MTLACAALAATASTPGFTPPGTVPSFLRTAYYPIAGAAMVALADVNHDGFVDILTANANNGASVLLGNGDGTFQPARTFLPTGNFNLIVSGDFDGDGNLDFAVTNYSTSTTVSVMLGNGDGTFHAAPDIVTGGTGISSLLASDFNNDGKTDLAITTLLSVNLNLGSYNLAVMLGQTGGAFTLGSNMAVGSGYSAIIGDFNRDGKQDMLITSTSAIKLGVGDGTFTNGVPYPLSVYSGMAYDINGDGILDIVAYTGGRTRSGPVVYSSCGNGDGTFRALCGFGPITGTNNFSGNILAADFNNDGLVDFVYAWGGTNNPFAASSWGGPIAWGPLNIGNLVTADFDRNGSLDLATVDGTGVYIARNTLGNPPVLSLEILDSAFVVGGTTTVTGTVTLGAPAPAGGAVIRLSSDNAAAFFAAGTTVTIPAGALSAPIAISTTAVAAATLINISATYGTVTLNASFTNVSAFTVSSVTFAPPSILGFFGGNFVQGTVTLTGPASDNVLVTLSSANTAVATVSPSVIIPAGGTSATFNASAFHVNASTPVVISATYQGTTRGGILNVLKGTDTVTITKTEYVVSKSQFKVEITTTDPAATFMRIFNATTGASIGSMGPAGGGKFVGSFNAAGPLTSVAAQSSSGGLAISPVTQR